MSSALVIIIATLAIGETGATAGPPSLGNALYAETGIRLRRLPIDRDVLAGKKPA